MTDMHFRPIDSATEIAARQIIIDGLTEHFGRYDGSLNPDVDGLVACYNRPGNVFLVGLVGGKVVCTGGLCKEDETTGRIVRMSVARPHRGKGCAFLMLKQLEEQAAIMGYQSIVLETNNDWDDALRLYGRWGYRVVRRDEEGTHFEKSLVKRTGEEPG